MNLQVWLLTLFKGRFMGQDVYGSRYYQARSHKRYGRLRRWVLYKGEREASRVPAAWHAWLHHMVEDPPNDVNLPHSWEKPHHPNLTGTPQAYRPPGWTNRKKTSVPYQSWRPEDL